MEEIYSAYKVEQINDHLFIDTYKSKNLKIGVNDMMVKEMGFPFVIFFILDSSLSLHQN